MFRTLKFVLGQKKCMINMLLCNKVPYNKVLLWLPVLYLYFWICVCLHMLCIKVYRKTSVGETRRDGQMRFDHKNHKIWEVMSEGPCTMKRAPSRPQSGPPGLLYGPPSPSWPLLTSCFVHDQVWAQYTLFLYVSLSVSIQIKNPMIINFKT